MAEEANAPGPQDRPPRADGEAPRKRARNRSRRRKPRREGENGNNENQNRQGGENQGRQQGGNRQGGARKKPRNNTRDSRSKQGNQNRSGSGQGRQRPPRKRPEPKLTLLQKVMKFFGFYTPPAAPERGMKDQQSKGRNARRPDATPHGEAERDDSRPPRKRSNRRRKKPQGETHQREDTTEAKKQVKSGELYLGNLSYEATEHDLKDLFSGVGSVRKVEVIYNKHTHRSKGYAFIRMSNMDEAKRAVDVLHDQYFLGRRMVVNAAKDRASYATSDEPLKEQKSEGTPENPPVSTAPTAAPTPEQIKERKEAEQKQREEAERKKVEAARAAKEAEEKAKAEAEAAKVPTPGVTTSPTSEPAAAENTENGTVVSEPVEVDLTKASATPEAPKAEDEQK